MKLTASARVPKNFKIIAIAALLQLVYPGATLVLQAQTEKESYPFMAPLDQYLIADSNAEVALARSAAPSSISDGAEVMVLGRNEYTTAVKGKNGFVCIVERSWGTTTDDPEFWNPNVRAPHCFNPAAAKTFLPIFLIKSKLVIARKSRREVAEAIASALDKKNLPELEPEAMCYMMSKQQFLNDHDTHWRPHLMFFVPGNSAKSWGANLPGSPVMSTYDAEQRVTIFFVPVGEWSDGTPSTLAGH